MLGVVLGCVAALGSSRAWADEKLACVLASEKGQELRSAGRLREAREELMRCARDVCPGIVRTDCGLWVGELEDELPSFVLVVHEASGQDLAPAEVLVDGVPESRAAAGRAVVVDPGPHTLIVRDGSGRVREERFLMHEGEKRRLLRIQFAAPTPKGLGEGGERSSSKGLRSFWPTLTMAGLSVAGFGAFAVLGLDGQTQVQRMRNACAPRCSDDEVASARRTLAMADVGLGVGLVSLGVAGYLGWQTLRGEGKLPAGPPMAPASVRGTPPPQNPSGKGVPRVDLLPLAGGGLARWTATF